MKSDTVMDGGRELRRAPRACGDAVLAWLRMRLNVGVIDISGHGVLLRMDKPLDVGAHGTIHLMLGRSPFTATVAVRHVSLVSVGQARGSYRVGAAFIGLSGESRQAIEQWTNL
jgi:hypothetical protein